MAAGYRSIVNAIRRAIESGEYPPGSAIPSESDLAAQYQVTRTTVQRAVNILREDGTVTSNRKGGTVVQAQPEPLDWYPGVFEHLAHRLDVPGSGADAWASDIIARGRTPRQTVSVSTISAPPGIRSRLNLGPTEKVVVRRRVRYVDNRPFQLADSYFPYELAVGTPIMDRGDVTIPGGFMAVIGHRQVRTRDEMIPRLTTASEMTRLKIVAAISVIEHTRTGFDRDDRPVRVMVTIHRFRIVYEMSTE